MNASFPYTLFMHWQFLNSVNTENSQEILQVQKDFQFNGKSFAKQLFMTNHLIKIN